MKLRCKNNSYHISWILIILDLLNRDRKVANIKLSQCVSLNEQFCIKDIVDNSDFAPGTIHDSIFKLEIVGLIVPVEKEDFDKTRAIPRQITQKGIEPGNTEIKSWLPNDKDYLNRVKHVIDEKIRLLVER